MDYFDSGTIATEVGATRSQISANIRIKDTLTFDAAADLAVSGNIVKTNDTNAAKIVKQGAGTLTLSGTNTYRSLEISAGKLVAARAGALGTGAVTVNGDGSILDFAVSGGTFTQGTNQALTTTGAGKITVSAGTLALTGAVNLSNAIEVANGASVTTTSDVKFALSGLTGRANEDGTTTFTLFTLESGAALTWNTLNAGNLNFTETDFSARGASATFNDDGTMTFTDGTAGNLTWVGDSAGAGTWNYAADNKPWTMGGADTAFVYNDNVTFDKDATVTVDAAGVAAGTVTIASGKTVSFTQGAVHAASFALGSGASLSLDAGSANGATATLADNSRYIVTATTGAFDFSNVSGTGSLVFRPTPANPGYDGRTRVELSDDFTGEFVLDSNVWLSFAADHSTFGGATIVLSGGALFHSTKTVNLTNDIRFDGEAAIWTDNGSATVTLSGDVTGSSGTLNRRGAGAMIFSKSVSVGTFNQETGATRVIGTATLGTASVSGGSLTFEGATNITSATVTGGTLKFDFGALNNAATFSSDSTLAVNGGTAIFGYDSGEGGTITDDSFGQNLSIVVGSGARMTIAIAKSSMKAFTGNLTLKNGATYYKFDGGVELTGDVTLGEADSDVVYLLGNWGKLGTKISGALSGAGTAYFGNEAFSDTTTEVLTISGSDNSYSGEIVVGKKNAGTNSARNTELVLSTATALQNGKVNLAGSAADNYAQLTLGANEITIAGLSGTEFGKVALGSGVLSSTLTLNQASDTTFSGTIADGIALKKTGAGTLKLSGDNSANTSGVTLSAGTLELGHNNALGGGMLTIQGTPELKLGTDARGNALTVSNTLSLTSSVIVSSAHDGNELSGSISAFGQEIRKVGSGTLTLSGTNTEGSFFIVNVAEGKIIAKTDTALGAGVGADFADYHKVRLSGGQLEVGSGVRLAQTNIEIALSSAYATTAAITGAADSALAADTVVTISSIDTADLVGVSLQTELAITRYDFKIADTLADGLTKADFSLAQGLLDSGWYIAGYENGTLSLTLTVPEPSAFGLLAGAGALALVAARRRRQKKA